MSSQDTFVMVNYTEGKSLFQTRGRVLALGDCVEVLNEGQARVVFTEGETLEKDPRLQNIQKKKQTNPTERLLPPHIQGTSSILKFQVALDSLIQTFRLGLVEVQEGVSFWYLFKNCDLDIFNQIYSEWEESFAEYGPSVTKSFSGKGQICFRGIPKKINGNWDPEDIAFHAYCTELENNIPGILTTIANWILYNMTSTGIRNFEIVENLLMSPYVNRPDLIEYFGAQYQNDINNLIEMAAPLGEPINLYRGSAEYNQITNDFSTNTFLATTNNPNVASTFAIDPTTYNTNYSKLKQFQIPPDYPVIDLRAFNPMESEVILIPPLAFRLLQKRKQSASTMENINVYTINLREVWFANNEGGGNQKKKTRKRSKKSRR